MIYQEAKQAMKSRCKIKLKGIVYKHINAIIFRKTENLEIIQLELQDMQANSVSICRIEQAEVADET